MTRRPFCLFRGRSNTWTWLLTNLPGTVPALVPIPPRVFLCSWSRRPAPLEESSSPTEDRSTGARWSLLLPASRGQSLIMREVKPHCVRSWRSSQNCCRILGQRRSSEAASRGALIGGGTSSADSHPKKQGLSFIYVLLPHSYRRACSSSVRTVRLGWLASHKGTRTTINHPAKQLARASPAPGDHTAVGCDAFSNILSF